MDISYLGHSSFRIKGKDASIVLDPYSSDSIGLKFPKVSADIVTVSHGHSDHNAADQVNDVKHVFEGPGEYEMMGVSLIGFPTYHDNKKGELRGKNTVFVIEIEKLRIAHLGDLGHKLTEKMIESMGEIDVLMVPIGGHYTIDSGEASEIVKAIEPKIVVPMHFKADGIKEELNKVLETCDAFLAKLDLPVENLDKLSLGSQLTDENTRVVVLKRI